MAEPAGGAVATAAELFDLRGRTALVTGASSGLGERFAEVLGRAGAKVVCAARRTDRLETLVELTFSEESQGEVRGQWGLWFDLWNEAFRHPEVAADRRALDEQWRGLIGRIVRAGIDEGQVAADLDVDTFSVTWAALLDGLSVQVALDDPVVTRDRAIGIALDFARRELGLV